MSYTIEIAANESSPLSFAGSPPQVSSVETRFAHVAGYYASSLRFEGLEVTGFTDAGTLEKVISLHEQAARSIVLLEKKPLAMNEGLLYKHDLPQVHELGIQFEGFPAKVKAVEKTSPLAGRVIVGQTVGAVIVPGRPILQFESGGFTGNRVQKYLQETASTPNRQLIVKDHITVPRSKHSKHEQRDPFDFGGFAGNWFRRQKS